MSPNKETEQLAIKGAVYFILFFMKWGFLLSSESVVRSTSEVLTLKNATS